MRTRLTIVSLLFFISANYLACTKPDIAFGADYLDNNYTNIVMIDTATVAISTVLLDSFVTSASGKAVIGKYNDPYFGEVAAESYVQVVPPAYQDVYSNSSFDSLEVILKPNKSYYGDTAHLVQIQVHQLAEPIALAENKTAFYNLNSFATNPTSLGSKTILVRPSVTDSISLRVSDALGSDLLTRLQLKDEVVQSPERFVNYFNGLRISVGGGNAFMLGFSDSVIMRLHYSKKGLTKEPMSLDFTLSDNTHQFNHISINRAGTALSAISAINNEIPSAATNHAGYLQTATGTITKISFPYLRDLLAVKNYLKIEKAELVVKPLTNSFNGYFPLPPQIRLSETTQLNLVGTDITTATSGSTTSQYGDLAIDNLYGENTGYVYDITSYINTQVAVTGDNKNGLLLSPPSPADHSDFNRLLIADKNFSNAGIKLRLYYITVNQN